MAEIPGYFAASTAITAIAFAAGAAVLISEKKKFPKVAAVLALWFALVFFLGKTGFFAANPLVAPNMMLAFIVLFIILQKVYGKIKVNCQGQWIIGIQTYRVVGWGFIILYQMKLLPGAFAIPSGIGDILIGVTAPFVAYAYAKKKAYSKKLAIAWNFAGIADLAIAISAGILAFPRPLKVLPTEISTEQMALFPLVIIPLFAVPLALLLHFISLRQIRGEKKWQ